MAASHTENQGSGFPSLCSHILRVWLPFSKITLWSKLTAGATIIHIPEGRKGKRCNAIQNKIAVVFLRKKVKTDISWQLVVSAVDLASGCLECWNAVTKVIYYIKYIFKKVYVPWDAWFQNYCFGNYQDFFFFFEFSVAQFFTCCQVLRWNAKYLEWSGRAQEYLGHNIITLVILTPFIFLDVFSYLHLGNQQYLSTHFPTFWKLS